MRTALWQDWPELKPLKDAENNQTPGDVIGNKTDTAVATTSEVASLMAYVKSLVSNSGTFDDSLGATVSGRAVTAALMVHPDGDGTDGLTWATAYSTIQDALDVASTDANDCTLILVSPHATFYDINTTGDPTWTGNYDIMGTHRLWAVVKNTHSSATSTLKFTGKVSLTNIAIFTEDSVDGAIFTKRGARVRKCGFNSESLTGEATSICLDGSAAATRGAIIEDVQFQGNVSYTKGLHISDSKVNEFQHLHMHNCFTAIHIEDSDSTGENSKENSFENIDIGDCTLGIDLDGGTDQHFENVHLHSNTANIDDEVEDAHWNNIQGEFPITIEPVTIPNYTGVAVSAGEDAYGADTEIRAAATSTKPFKVVGYRFEPSEEKKFMLRFSADSGSTFFNMALLEVKKNKANGATTGTDFIFNSGTRISCSAGCEAAGKTIQVWLEIQEI